jgi:hypothetical protein
VIKLPKKKYTPKPDVQLGKELSVNELQLGKPGPMPPLGTLKGEILVQG